MKGLTQLKAERKKARKKWEDLDRQVEYLTRKKGIPSLRKKYEGKYFKFDNGTSDYNRWWLYVFCRKVKSDMYGMFDEFQVTHGVVGRDRIQHEFVHNQENSLCICAHEITKEEYLSELKKFKAPLEKLSH